MSNYTMQDDELIDNAACSSQSRELNEDQIVREAVQLNCINPLRKRIAELEAERDTLKAERDALKSEAEVCPADCHSAKTHYNAGMERAAEIVDNYELGGARLAGNKLIAYAIRAEISGGDDENT